MYQALSFSKFMTLAGLVTISAAVSSARAVVNESTARYDRYERGASSLSTSADLREGKKILVVGSPVGINNSLAGFGATAGYYLNRDSILQLQASAGRLEVPNLLTLSGESIGVNLKHFLGNSFYLKGGAGYRSYRISDLTCASCSSYQPDQWGSSKAIGAEFAIGNQWQFENFTIGCDWIGAMVPVLTLSSAEVNAPTMSSSSRRELQDAWDRVGKATSYSILHFYLGASF